MEDDSEYGRIYEFTEYINKEQFLPEFIYLSYTYKNECIKNVSVDDVEHISSIEDIKNIYNEKDSSLP